MKSTISSGPQQGGTELKLVKAWSLYIHNFYNIFDRFTYNYHEKKKWKKKKTYDQDKKIMS